MSKKIKLFCFPYAGASATIYSKWRRYLPDYIELHPIELSGKGGRIGEKLYHSLDEAVEDIYKKIKKHINDSSYSLFGHSLGGLIAYELYQKLKEKNEKLPSMLFISGSSPPHRKKSGNYHLLSDKEFKEYIISMGGIPKELIEDEILFDFFLPALRCDFKMIETYISSQRNHICIDTGLAILYGKSDPLVDLQEINEWEDYMQGRFFIESFDGNHFFINEQTENVVKFISECLDSSNSL
ncbi:MULTISPECIES: thioesterase II family protein [unclassified Bacillus (in: firmicutes)]|uniref:thioesterase II family protein n=1 Tax=unclassified Bacillus (in: firmicutes) TaxID=185979 RepID=UPI000BF6B0EA|nr:MULTISPECIES: thioesterase domain-containing protein [unclassified Bacillus (in: firmicutes)]PEU19243.1 thioesterase [Bacillus sp. AFS014408]PFW62157.1 thioesterase [Bacillus sp. AFS075034]